MSKTYESVLICSVMPRKGLEDTTPPLPMYFAITRPNQFNNRKEFLKNAKDRLHDIDWYDLRTIKLHEEICIGDNYASGVTRIDLDRE